MSAFSKLGLYANRQPTDTIQQARVGQGTIGDKIARGEVDLAKLIRGAKKIRYKANDCQAARRKIWGYSRSN